MIINALMWSTAISPISCSLLYLLVVFPFFETKKRKKNLSKTRSIMKPDAMRQCVKMNRNSSCIIFVNCVLQDSGNTKHVVLIKVAEIIVLIMFSKNNTEHNYTISIGEQHCIWFDNCVWFVRCDTTNQLWFYDLFEKCLENAKIHTHAQSHSHSQSHCHTI